MPAMIVCRRGIGGIAPQRSARSAPGSAKRGFQDVPLDASPRIVAIGPNFQDIANTKGITATALRVFLTTLHPKIPNLILTPEDTANVIAYILMAEESASRVTKPYAAG
jgi:hypothetical protein